MRRTPIGILLLFCLVAPGFGQLQVLLDDPNQWGAPGDTLTFTGSLSNVDIEPDFLNGASLTLDDPGLLGDTTFFNVFAPLSLDPGVSSGSIPLFTIAIDPFTVAPGLYQGEFDVTGGPGQSDSSLLGTADFTITVTPEPHSTALILCAGLTILAAVRRQARH
jgi:hypothetical protein